MSNAILTASLGYTPPGGGSGSATAVLTATAPYTAESIGIMDIPASTIEGVEFQIPFGTISEAFCLVIKNTNSQSMGVRFNAVVGVGPDEYQMPPGGELIINHPVGAGTTVADGVTNTDVSFVSATAAFVTADETKRIIIAGAGAGGTDLDTTIDTVTNPTTIILTDPTSSTDTDVTATWSTPMAKASVVTTAVQGASGTVQYFVFGI